MASSSSKGLFWWFTCDSDNNTLMFACTNRPDQFPVLEVSLGEVTTIDVKISTDEEDVSICSPFISLFQLLAFI